MIRRIEEPHFEFLCHRPKDLLSRPSLSSSLQSLETPFFLIAFQRYPHALVTCASAIESAMKATLGLKATRNKQAWEIFKMASENYPALRPYRKAEEKFRQTRNRIIHAGFSPKDDEVAAKLLLNTGYPILIDCYREFFEFSLMASLHEGISYLLSIAFEVYSKTKNRSDLRLSYCLQPLGHSIRWSFGQSLKSEWENQASRYGDEFGIKYQHQEKQKEEIENAFITAWSFDCPVCDGSESFICELDDKQLEKKVITFNRAVCIHCGMVIPHGCPFMTNSLCRDQIEEREKEIFVEFGIGETQK